MIQIDCPSLADNYVLSNNYILHYDDDDDDECTKRWKCPSNDKPHKTIIPP